MTTMTELVQADRARLGAWLAGRVQKRYPSVIRTAGFVIDHNSTGVSAQRHRYRQ